MRTIDVHLDLSNSGYSQALEMEIRELLTIWKNIGKIRNAEAAWSLKDNVLVIRLNGEDPNALLPEKVTREEHPAFVGIQLLTGASWTVSDCGIDPRFTTAT